MMSGTFPRRRLAARAAAMAAAATLPRVRPAAAQAWPAQPLRLVVPFAPGGTTDLVARMIGQGLGERLGQPVIVENRPGAGATVGSQQVAAAAPDGHTLLMSNIASHGIGPTLYRTLRYDAVRDFAHIGLVVESPSVWVANARFPGRTLADVTRLSLADGRGIDIASSGAGSSNHLLIVQFGQLTGARVNHVPYRGAGPAMTDVIAGVVPMMSDSLPSSVPHLRQGSVRALAMSSVQRHPGFPEVPTFREQGVDLVSTSWFGLSAPAGTPAPVVQRLAAALRAVLDEPALAARFAEFGGTPGRMGPEDYTTFIRTEIARWGPVVQSSGAQVE
jgi:tripartite-type tricarboxylate transporter receptor subunit TctC